MTRHGPSVSGTSVVAIKYKDGVIMAADTLGSVRARAPLARAPALTPRAQYGSLARFIDIKRIMRANGSTLVGGDGDIADLQAVDKILRDLDLEDRLHDDGLAMGPRDILTLLARMQYNRRSKMDPLWNSLVVAGWDEVGCASRGSWRQLAVCCCGD
jgi:20S proteasome subunit beta 7